MPQISGIGGRTPTDRQYNKISLLWLFPYVLFKGINDLKKTITTLSDVTTSFHTKGGVI
jgi:hypothetical protein